MIKKIIFDSIETLIRDSIWTQARSFVDDHIDASCIYTSSVYDLVPIRSNVAALLSPVEAVRSESIFQFVREQTREMNNK